MKRFYLHLIAAMCFATNLSAQTQILKSKIIEKGGLGAYKAIAIEESDLQDFVVYRPQNLDNTVKKEGKLPIVAYANGGCMNTSIHVENFLNEIASHGYVVVAIGKMQDQKFDREEKQTSHTELKRGLDLIINQATNPKSPYFNKLDTSKAIYAGYSCGGAQVLANANDSRIKSYIIINSGIGDMQMANADKNSLKNLHAPVLYITGGPSDVAYLNAQKDFQRINHVPVFLTDHPTSGHQGTYSQPHGGDYAKMVLHFLDWQTKNKSENADLFVNNNMQNFCGWYVQHKNYNIKHGQIKTIEMPCKLLEGVSKRQLTIYLPPEYEKETSKKYPVLYLMHGGGGKNTDYKDITDIKNLADRMINDNKTCPMIIVTPEGNENNMMYFNSPNWKYEDFFFNELIPYIESNFRAKTTKDARAIGGFSMGGGAATVYGIKYPEKFAFIYNISGYLRRQDLDFLKKDPSAEWRQQIIEQNNPIKTVENASENQIQQWKNIDWTITVGDQDFTLEANMDFIKQLRAKNIPYTFRVNSGNHNWDYVNPEIENALIKANEIFAKD